MLNCLMKPQFILDCIKKLNEPVIWIDIDCTINQLPTELDSIETDIALAIREHDLKTPHSALLFFNNTEKSISFLEEWIELCKLLIQNQDQEMENNYLKILQNYFLIELCQKAEKVEKEIWEI